MPKLALARLLHGNPIVGVICRLLSVLLRSLRQTVVAVVAVFVVLAVVTATFSFCSSSLHASVALLLSRG